MGNCCCLYFFQSDWLILGHFCNMTFSSSQFAILYKVWSIYWKMLIIRFLKVLGLEQGFVTNCLIYLLTKSFLYIFQSDSLIFGHICNKMFSSSQFAIFAICMIYILTKCLRWSFSKCQVGPEFCGKLFDKPFCRKLSTYSALSLVILKIRCLVKVNLPYWQDVLYSHWQNV